MEVSINIVESDYWAIQSFITTGDANNADRTNPNVIVKNVFLWAVVSFTLLSILHEQFDIGVKISPVFLLTLLAAGVLFIGYLWWAQRSARTKFKPLEDGFVLGRRRYEFNSEGFIEHATYHQTSVNWKAVLEICDTEEHIFIMVDRVGGYIFPKREFGAQNPAETFLAQIRALHDSVAHDT